MKIVNILIIVIVALLSIAAGLAKVMQTPQEMEFLQGFGLSPIMIVIFGLIQVVGGVLVLPAKTRLPGAVLAALAFAVSTMLIFIGGNMTFGLVSMLPLAMACLIIFQSAKAGQTRPVERES
jgi:hypothetical protein